MRPSIVTKFWKVSSGTATGFIEKIGSSGYIFKNDGIVFRLTTSKLATGKLYNLSLSNRPLLRRQKDFIIAECKNALKYRKPVTVEYECHIIGNPTKGDICCPSYVRNIKDQVYGSDGLIENFKL